MDHFFLEKHLYQAIKNRDLHIKLLEEKPVMVIIKKRRSYNNNKLDTFKRQHAPCKNMIT